MMHSGHFNALRQARKLGDILVAGVHSDDEITRAKGMPVLNNEERMALVKACKWVDEIVFDTPYNPTVELLDKLNCDFVAHGDDIGPTYAEVMEAGRLKVIKRTEGVSTTDIVGRLLLMTKDHHDHRHNSGDSPNSSSRGFHRCPSVDAIQDAGQQPFMPTTMRISQFANNKTPKDGDVVVYIDGSFDLYHPGHVRLLEMAKAMGDFLYVGLHHDSDINEIQGANYPVCTLHERALCVLSCKHVDEVVFGTPFEVSADLISLLNINIVVDSTDLKVMKNLSDEERELETKKFFAVPIEMGIFHRMDEQGQKAHSTQEVITRIVDNRLNYMKKYEKKAAAEAEYRAGYVHVAEQ
eukprot:TRINITY_DN7418_c0_g2_i3.p1 TRINITY_DN7418_c0_g2~~TRINITY_DN7418_c0_g2_i3.p1  ORF type:complete len:353 (+),score=108.62 TRINITY_DN7418_c0_g2_i3:197-1255(+)